MTCREPPQRRDQCLGAYTGCESDAASERRDLCDAAWRRRGNHRCPARQCLQHHVGQPLVARTHHKRISLCEERIRVLLKTEKVHPVGYASVSRKLLERGAQWTFAQERQAQTPQIK